MNLLEFTAPSPAANLACDEALLLQWDELLQRNERLQRDESPQSAHSTGGSIILSEAPAAAHGGCLRLWESDGYAVVLGRSNRVGDEVNVAACRRDGVPVLRRCSGGGAVVLGPGCLLFSLVMPAPPKRHLHGIPAATQEILTRIADGLDDATGRIEVCGTSDLAIGGRKFSGNSQRWGRQAMLHHGTLLYDFDIGRVARYLHLPQRRPEYRGSRSHGDFLMNVPIPREVLCRSLITTWQAVPAPMSIPHETIAELARTRYERDEWNLG